ncbi:repressor protein cI [Pseudomonas phage PotUPM1]|nr:repressor protein cI [Pseudomonas phage PotUPM1]
MDIYAIRKQNLIALIGTRRKNACAQKWEMSAAHLSQILSDKTEKNLGDDVARRIETLEGLERGWLDQLRDVSTAPLDEGQSSATPQSAADIVRAMLETKAGKSISPEARERLLLAAIETGDQQQAELYRRRLRWSEFRTCSTCRCRFALREDCARCSGMGLVRQ